MNPIHKVIIQIPCYNEENTLPETIGDLPRTLAGVDVVEYLIIDDGSQDRTIEVAQELGVHHIVKLKKNQGLARAFTIGLEHCLKLGADIIVNTDGDNQYNAKNIHDLVEPIVQARCDMVIGYRDMEKIPHFSWIKRRLQHLGSYVVRKVSGTEVRDTTSGFRAFSRDLSFRLLVHSPYTYTLETIIQAGKRGVTIEQIEVEVNDPTRRSRLMKSIPSYIRKSLLTMVRVYSIYEPFRFFGYLSLPFFITGLLAILRFLVLFLINPEYSGYIQSVVLGGVSLISGFIILMVGFLGDMMQSNRRLSEDVLYRVRKLEDQVSHQKVESPTLNPNGKSFTIH